MLPGHHCARLSDRQQKPDFTHGLWQQLDDPWAWPGQHGRQAQATNVRKSPFDRLPSRPRLGLVANVPAPRTRPGAHFQTSTTRPTGPHTQPPTYIPVLAILTSCWGCQRPQARSHPHVCHRQGARCDQRAEGSVSRAGTTASADHFREFYVAAAPKPPTTRTPAGD